MNYYKVVLPICSTANETEILIAQLTIIGFESFEEQEDYLIGYIPENEYCKDELIEIEYCNQCENSGTLLIEFMPEKNWNEVWESNYPSVTIADSCYIRAPFHDSKPSMDFEILIKPKMAFGTAHHETTSLILEIILENDFENKKVLDMGCGTGVLAILASMKGAISVIAIDFDHWSYENTVENAEANSITNINAVLGDADSIPNNIYYDTIFANINKNVLLRDMKYYTDALLVGGNIIFSGFYVNDLSDIESKAKSFGLKLIRKHDKNNWIAAEFIKESLHK